MLTAVAAVFMMSCAVVQANHCPSAGECLSKGEPIRGASLLQQSSNRMYLKMETDFNVAGSNRAAESIADYECNDTNRAQYKPLWHPGAWGAHKTPGAIAAAAEKPCGRAGPRSDFKQFAGKVDGPWMPCCEKRQFHVMLQWFHDVVKSMGDEFWYALADGTLLGSVRDGDMIDWDTDMDIAVPNERMTELVTLLKAAAAKEDPPYYLTKDGIDSLTYALRLRMSHDNTAHIDIWPSQVDQACVKLGPEIFPFPNSTLFPLQKCKLGNGYFPCAKDKEKFLAYQYGDDWQTPGTNKHNPNKPPLPASCPHFRPMLYDLSSEVPQIH